MAGDQLSALDATDYAAAADVLGDLEAIARPKLEAAQLDGAQAIAAATRARARRHHRTGALERGIDVELRGDAVAVVTGATAPFVIGGTAPHLIGARPGHALRMQPIGGALIGFAPAVRHPGYRGDPLLSDGAQDADHELGGILEGAGLAIVDELADRMGG